MDKVLTTILEILTKILPESDFGKVMCVLIIVLLLLIITGRLKLEWIGKGMRYLWCRCLKCPLGQHSWRLAGVGYLSASGGVRGPYICKYCRKQDYFTGTMY